MTACIEGYARGCLHGWLALFLNPRMLLFFHRDTIEVSNSFLPGASFVLIVKVVKLVLCFPCTYRYMRALNEFDRILKLSL